MWRLSAWFHSRIRQQSDSLFRSYRKFCNRPGILWNCDAWGCRNNGTMSSLRSISQIVSNLPKFERPEISINTKIPPYTTQTLPPIIILERNSHSRISHLSNNPRTLLKFTDGSLIPHKNGNQVGYGIAAFNDQRLVANCHGRLPPHATVFQAEGTAILNALLFAKSKFVDYTTIEIPSD